ncbi:hypothetical protein Scani_44080 [Streptomyces caniferus]|uniref:Uncharacterized protein n=1 Tax=Streptomyces caniferus TaxID=285557 RepID=A0A640SAF6_9ACTN|nr:hypothetical protein Scani_44080 [Streptomyces caniferus]
MRMRMRCPGQAVSGALAGPVAGGLGRGRRGGVVGSGAPGPGASPAGQPVGRPDAALADDGIQAVVDAALAPGKPFRPPISATPTRGDFETT